MQFAFIWYPTTDDKEPEPSEKDGYKCPSCGSRDINSEEGNIS